MVQLNTLQTLKVNRKDLRASATPQEIILWSKLRRIQLGVKFRRQHSIGSYILDFYCSEKKLAVELDGWQHAENILYDTQRTEFLNLHGIRVLRFWNDDVNDSLDGVLLEIQKKLYS